MPENRSAFLAATLARALPHAHPGAIALAVTAMQTAARAAKRWSETTCSYPLTDAQQRRGDRRVERLAGKAWLALYSAAASPDMAAHSATLARVATVSGDSGQGWESVTAHGRTLTLRFGGDPRGPCGWLHVSDMPGDGWSADDGFAIYS